MQKKRFLVVVMLLTVPIAAQVKHTLPFSRAIVVASMAARDQGYDPSRSDIYLKEIFTPDGRVAIPRYVSIGLYRNGQFLRDYAIRIATGDVVDPDNCEILRYPNLLKFKQSRIKKLGTHEASLNLITSEVGCDKLRPVGGPAPALSNGKPSPALKQELTAQGFTGLFTGDVTFRTLGTFLCGNRRLRVIYYTWTETTPGVDPHGAARILLMDGKTYLGSYSVEYPPEIHGKVLQFPHVGDPGYTITCGKKGVLPQNAWLDGELNPLFQ